MKPESILTLSDPLATLENVGGKGMSLAKLIRAGLPVPDGFHVTTDAYRQFVTANDLQPKIARFREMPAAPGQPPLAEEDEDLVLHVELPSSADTC